MHAKQEEIEQHVNALSNNDDDIDIDVDITTNVMQNKTNNIFYFNMPPISYCNSYTSLCNLFNIDDAYPMSELLNAANTKLAVCPVTHFAISTPFIALAWAQRLAATRYPNPAAAITLVKCLRVGVALGFYGNRDRTQIGPNLESAREHPTAIDTNIEAELANGRRKGPFSPCPFSHFYSNPLGVVFKKVKLSSSDTHCKG